MCVTLPLKSVEQIFPSELIFVFVLKVWRYLDEEIASTPMPHEYRNYMVSILCRDCHKVRSIRYFYIEPSKIVSNSIYRRRVFLVWIDTRDFLLTTQQTISNFKIRCLI